MADSAPPKRSPSPSNRHRSRSPPPRRDKSYRERDDRDSDRDNGRRWRGGRDWDRERGGRRDDYRGRRGGRRDRDSMADDYPYRRRPAQNQDRRDDEGARERDNGPRRNDRYDRNDRGDRNDRYDRGDRNERHDGRYRRDRFDSDMERGSRRGDREREDGPWRRRDEEDEDNNHVDLPPTETQPSKPKKTPGFKWKDEPPSKKSSSSNPKSRQPTNDPSSGLTFTGRPKGKKKDVVPKNATAISKTGGGQEEMIVVHVNDRLGTKAAIPCYASDRIREFKIMVAARIGREPHEILLKRQGERPFKDQLTLEDYGVGNGVQIDLEVDTGD